MATRPTFLTRRFGGYLHRDVPQEDAELTHVGPGTPCGEYLRRFWQPVCFTDELHDLPVRVNLLGEELVVFRDLSGAIGLLELRCPHRGTSLEYGLVGAKGIRCCYHAWLFDVDGTILETPGEPADSTLKDRLCHGAYPTHEYHGIVFAYMGPPDLQPPFPIYDSFTRPGYRLLPGRSYVYPCNWLQIMENAMDPVHTAFLHTIVSGAQFTDQFGVIPELEFSDTPLGMMYIATRRVGDNVWARMVEAILPNLQQVAPAWEDGLQEHAFSGPMLSRWIVPQDDTHTMLIEFRHVSESEGVTPAWFADCSRMIPGQFAADSYEAGQRHPVTMKPRSGSGRSPSMRWSTWAPRIVASPCSDNNPPRHSQRSKWPGSRRFESRRRHGHPDLRERHGRARATGSDDGRGRTSVARDRVEVG